MRSRKKSSEHFDFFNTPDMIRTLRRGGYSARTTGCKNDPKLGKKARSKKQEAFLCYLLLEKLSKSLIPRGDYPFVLNRPPCFSWKISLFHQGRA
jgi:hypothetical protein